MKWGWPQFWLLLVLGVLLSLLVTLVLHQPWGLFLFLPFAFPPLVIWPGRGRPAKTSRCQLCRYETSDPEVRYCPRDGRLLQTSGAAPS